MCRDVFKGRDRVASFLYLQNQNEIWPSQGVRKEFVYLEVFSQMGHESPCYLWTFHCCLAWCWVYIWSSINTQKRKHTSSPDSGIHVDFCAKWKTLSVILQFPLIDAFSRIEFYFKVKLPKTQPTSISQSILAGNILILSVTNSFNDTKSNN